MNIKICLQAHCSNGAPFCHLEVNDILLFIGPLNDGLNKFEFDIPTDDTNVLKIHHLLKNGNDTIVDEDGKVVADKAIELKSISLDDIAILDTVLYNKHYYVEWPQYIQEDFLTRGETVPEYIKNTLYFGHNGRYEFNFGGDFLKQYYRQFWENEDQAHNNQTKLISLNGQDVESFERFGEDTAVNQAFDLTIHDLARMIEDE